MHAGRKAEIIKAEFAVDQRARRIYSEHGIDASGIDPLAALLAVAADAEAWRHACKVIVGELDQLRFKSGNELKAEVALFERSMDRSARILGDLARLGIESRLVKLEEAKTDLMANALDWLLGAFGVAGSDVARRQVAAMLRAVSDGRVPDRLPGPVLRLVETAGEVGA